MTPKDWAERLKVFFSHPTFIALAGRQLHQLRTVAAELIDNALNKGKGGASRVTVDIVDRRLLIGDDGAVFNSLEAPYAMTPQMRGLRAIRSLIKAAGSEVTFRYIPKDAQHTRFNLTELQIQAPAAVPRDACCASGPTQYLMNRTSAVEFVDNLLIPASCESFVLKFEGDTFFSYSAGSEIILRMLQRLQGRKLRIKIGHYAADVFNSLRFAAEGHPDVSIEQE